MIADSGSATHLKNNESFIRTVGTLAFVSNGLLKEYDAENRKSPSIINFVNTGDFLITRKHNRHHYLKTCSPSLIYSWDFEQLQEIYTAFGELKPVYDLLCESYDQSLSHRPRLLEEKVAGERIRSFIKLKREILWQLKKKDIANYLNLSYIGFVRNYNKYL